MYNTFDGTSNSSFDGPFDNNLNDNLNDKLLDSSICYICFENKPKLKLECKHTICKECLVTFLKSSLEKNCPWCRHNISTKQIKKLLPTEYNRVLCINDCIEIFKCIRSLVLFFFPLFVFLSIICYDGNNSSKNISKMIS
jgi:hypothetical protein